MVAPGEPAPDFSAHDSDGHPVKLSDFRGKQRVVLYFFPKCFTPGCDIEAGRFRDDYPKFQGKGTQVLGVSTDEAEVARKFREKFRLPFPLLPDPQGSIVKLFGVAGSTGHARRVSFLVGLDGKVEQVVDDRAPEPHVARNLERLG